MAKTNVPFEGCYRRLIDIRRQDAGTVVVWMEDDYHHFGITLLHDGAAVTAIRTAAARFPWTTCPSAGEPLRGLIGQPLVARASDIGQMINMRLQCTHLFDLAGMALAHAHHGRDRRRYHATVEKTGPDSVDVRQAVLRQDGAVVMTWDLDGANDIVGPDPYGGRSTDRGFREWTETMPVDEAEWAFVLRRAVFVANGRTFAFSGVNRASEMGVPAVCHTYQPGTREHALRDGNHVVRHDSGPDGMLALVNTTP